MANPAVQHARFLAPGDKLGKHELIRQIAVGGMAELYLARTTGLEGFEKLVVLKRILPQLAGNQSFVSMFLNEARLAATLHHPNIAQVFDIGQDGGDYFFSMEYIHGQDLGHLVASASSSGVPISLDAALTLVAGLCAGLHYAHEKAGPDGKPLNVVHRDVSPSNVLVSYEGAVKLVDFGIARAGSNPTTSRGGLKGKIAYMSPEQCRGKATLDRRSDVFSIGTILYELTTGRLPFTDETEYGILNQIVNRDAEPPSRFMPGFSPALEAILLRALARSPDQRYATALEMQKALEDFAHENRHRVSPLVLGRLMGTLYPARLEEWDHARAQGAFFVEQHVVRTLIENRKGTEGPQLPEASEADAAAAPVHVNGAVAAPVGAARARTGERARSPLPGTPMGRANAGVPPPRASSPVIGAGQAPRRPSEQAIGPGQMPRRPSEPTLRAPTPTPPPGTHPPAPPYAAAPEAAGGPMQGRMATPVPGRLPSPVPVPGQPGAVPIVTPYPGAMTAPPPMPSRATTVQVPGLAPPIPPTPMPAMGSPIPPTPMPTMAMNVSPMGMPPMGMPPMGAPMGPPMGAPMGPPMMNAGTLVTSQTSSGSVGSAVPTVTGVGEVTERVRVRPPDVSGPTMMIRVRRSRKPWVLLSALVVIGAAVAIAIVLNGARTDVDTRPAASETPGPAPAPAQVNPAAAKASDPAAAKADNPPAPPEPTAAKADDPAAAKADDPAAARTDDAAKKADDPAKTDDAPKPKTDDAAAKPDDAAAKADDPAAAKTAKKPTKPIRQPTRVKQTRITTPKKDPKKPDPDKEPKWTPDSPFMPVRPPDKK